MKKNILLLSATLLLAVLMINLVAAQGATYCCERTVDGAKCQNAPEAECNDEYRKAPTACSSTGYCANVCCFDSDEGTCMPNTPRISCTAGGGVENPDPSCSTAPQCQLGCCLLGGQAAFVTQTRCKTLSQDYGLLTNFRTDIQNEVQCILTTTSELEGACVFEKEFQRTCLRLSQRECNQMALNDDSVEFYPGMLCSADELATNCGKWEKTTCIDGKDQVYFLDSCGNVANVYDASKLGDDEASTNYWRDIISPRESCELNTGDVNNDASKCGNCDYLLGTVCKEYELGMDNPDIGDYVCSDMGCEYTDLNGNTETYKHGETWCAVSDSLTTIYDLGRSDIDSLEYNLPGSRYFRLLCYDGEVLVEPCADYRQEICLQTDSSFGNEIFRSASCRVNRWEDCVALDDDDDCENEARRDCKWVTGSDITGPNTGDLITVAGAEGVCLPKYSPGFKFWDSEEDGDNVCETMTRQCKIEYERGYEKDLGGLSIGTEKEEWKAVDNQRCDDISWGEGLNEACVTIGDCGVSDNYIKVGLEAASFYDFEDLYELSKRYDAEEYEEEYG